MLVEIIDGLEVRQVPSFPEYGTTECGKVYRISKKKLMATRIIKHTKHDYFSVYVRLSSKGKATNQKLHRLVIEAWKGSAPEGRKNFVNHIDGDSLNNHVDNLEWCSLSENQRHAISTGLKGKGSELYNASLTEEQVHEICKKLKDGARTKDLSDEYCVSVDAIRKIKAGDTYFHVRSLYDLEHNYKFCFSDATIKWVCSKIVEGYGDREIVEISTNPNLTIIEIKRIRYKIRYKYISDLYF
jgi:hypothetical protein